MFLVTPQYSEPSKHFKRYADQLLSGIKPVLPYIQTQVFPGILPEDTDDSEQTGTNPGTATIIQGGLG